MERENEMIVISHRLFVWEKRCGIHPKRIRETF